MKLIINQFKTIIVVNIIVILAIGIETSNLKITIVLIGIHKKTIIIIRIHKITLIAI
jgi:hypothetical protein